MVWVRHIRVPGVETLELRHMQQIAHRGCADRRRGLSDELGNLCVHVFLQSADLTLSGLIVAAWQAANGSCVGHISATRRKEGPLPSYASCVRA
jgi:hypothetical protein